MIVEIIPFFKAIVIKVDLFGSKIIDEKNFKTLEDAQEFKRGIITGNGGLLCIVCQM